MTIFIASIIGIILGLLLPVNISLISVKSLTIIVLVGVDVIFSSTNAKINKDFNALLFTNEFILNTIITIGLVYLGNIMGLDLFIPLMIVLIGKMLYNLSKLIKSAVYNRISVDNNKGSN